MSGFVPKIKVEAEKDYTPISVKNPININGISIEHEESEDSDSTVEPDELVVKTAPIEKSFKSEKSSAPTKKAKFSPEDYQNFVNSSKTRAEKKYDSEEYDSDSESGNSDNSESSDYSDSMSENSEDDKKSNANKKEEKQTLLLKLYALEKKGVELTKKFSMNSKLSDLKFEYELHKNSAEIEMSIKLQQKILVAAITGLEFVNKKFDPIGAKLDGWSESIMDNLDDYESVFTKLHEKYKHRADLPPELQLLVTLAGSAFMFHMTKTMFSSIMPNKENPNTADIIKNMMQQNTQSTPKNMFGDISGPSSNFSHILKDDDTISTGSVETSKEVTVNQKGKRAINL
jgi:hypothetical protein